MKSPFLISVLASISLLLANHALADGDRRHDRHHHKSRHQHHHYHKPVRHHHVEYDYPAEYARVVSSRPIYRTVAVDVPVDSCRVETVGYSERSRGGDSFKGTVIGGLVGAAIGREIGHSNHATAAGGLIGATIGNDMNKGGRTTRYEDREVCQTRYHTQYERQLVGYDVSYVHAGRSYRREMARHPGNRIAIDVAMRVGNDW